MARELSGFKIGWYPAAEDLSSDQYHLVTLASGAIRRPDAANEKYLGILQNAPAAGQAAEVMVEGVSKLAAGSGGLAEGDYVTGEYVGADDAGKGLATTTARDVVRAICLEAAGAEDDLATVRLVHLTHPETA